MCMVWKKRKMITVERLRIIKQKFIGEITPENKKEINKKLRKIDKIIKQLLRE